MLDSIKSLRLHNEFIESKGESMKTKRIIPYPLRIRADLREWVKKTAESNRRSMNAELTVLIEQAKAKQEQQAHEPA